MFLTFFKLIVFFTLSTSTRVPSYRERAFVIIERYDPIMVDYCYCGSGFYGYYSESAILFASVSVIFEYFYINKTHN